MTLGDEESFQLDAVDLLESGGYEASALRHPSS